MAVRQTGSLIRLSGICLFLFGGLFLISSVFIDLRRSIVIGREDRFYMVVSDSGGNVAFSSFDPAESKVVLWPLPPDLYIKSRSVGEYKVGTLMGIGSLEGDGGEFVRRKIQGFMRIPIMGFTVIEGEGSEDPKASLKRGLWRVVFSRNRGYANLSRLDALTLLLRLRGYRVSEVTNESLLREGVFTKREGGGYAYNQDRLASYVKEEFFDWAVGDEGYSVAVVNCSGILGLGSDTMEFLQNMGADVVLVRDDPEVRRINSFTVTSKGILESETTRFLQRVFAVEPSVKDTTGERADIVFYVGQDMKGMF